jgi:hypothetical protein
MAQGKKVKWYVYVLTNPSFREDWVKIWKSSRPVDVRSKELDNTAVPLPFEIYATIQSSKYEFIEQHMHDVFWRYAEKRIRKWREFFNVRPEVVYKEFLTQAKIAWDGKVLWPDYYQKGKVVKITNSTTKSSKEKPPKLPEWASSSKEYHFRHTNAVPKARLIVKNWEYIVKKWSTVCPVVSDKSDTAKRSREKWKDYIKDNKTTKDISFESPSWAWKFVYWNSTNWKWSWIDDDWNTLSENIINWI